jgi:hypothetical protein
MAELGNSQSFKEIAEKGAAIYEKIKGDYEPDRNGKYLAIEIDSEESYLGDNGGEAIEAARKAHPEKFFYLVKIGFSSAEILAHSLVGHQ